jgi:hypothetical protein
MPGDRGKLLKKQTSRRVDKAARQRRVPAREAKLSKK